MSKFWNGIYTQPDYAAIAIKLEGQHYIIGKSGAQSEGFKGHSGRIWLLIRDKQLLVTDNLWHQGTYPSYLGYDNAVIATEGSIITIYGQESTIEAIKNNCVYLSSRIVVPTREYTADVFTYNELFDITNEIIRRSV